MTTVVDPFLVVVTCVFTVLLVVANVYILAHYSHYADSTFGASTSVKVIVIVSFMIAQSQMLVLPLDVSNTREGSNIDLQNMWYIIYMTSAFFITITLPSCLFFYEADEERTFKQRVWQAIKQEIIIFFLLLIIVLVSFLLIAYADFPVVASTCVYDAANQGKLFLSYENNQLDAVSDICSRQSESLRVTISFPVYLIALMSFVGNFLMVFFVGAGIWAIPFDFMNAWRQRPIKMASDQFDQAKQDLAKKIQELIQMGKLNAEKRKECEQNPGSCCTAIGKRRKIKKEFTEFEANCLLAEREFQRLDKVSQYRNVVEPLKYTFYFFVSILCFLLTPTLIVHVLIFVLIQVNGRAIHPFLNYILEDLENSDASFLGGILFAFIGYYLMLAGIKGNVKFGLRFFWISFYPMLPGETFFNSFLFNALIMNLWTCSLTQFMTKIFRQFVRGTDIALIFEVQVKNMWFYSGFFKYDVFEYIFIIWTIVCMFYFFLKPQESMTIGLKLKKRGVNRQDD